MLPGAAELLAARELPQRDGLCGPFWAALALRVLAGRDQSQEDVALAAGTRSGGPPVLPPGERSSPPACPLPTGLPEQAGTSAAGLVAALAPLPVVAVPGRQITSAQLTALLTALQAWPVPLACLANLATGELDDTWSVGHVVALVGQRDGQVAVADSYASLGVHEHPAERVAAALRRDGEAAEGGLLLVSQDPLDAVAQSVGLPTGLWDNGTPFRPAAP